MKTLAFCAAYAVFASVFCIGFAASQLPSETTFTILSGVIIVLLGIGFTLFFAEEIRTDIKQIAISVVFLSGVCGAIVFAYSLDYVRAKLIGTWSSEIVLIDGLAQTNKVGLAACYQLLTRDRLTAIRAIVARPVYAQTSCVASTDDSFKHSLLNRWDERLFSKTGSAADADAVSLLEKDFPIETAAILFDCAVRAQSDPAKERCIELSKEFDVVDAYQKDFGWWTERKGLSTRFTASFNESGDSRLTERFARRVVLRQVCEQVGTADAEPDLISSVEGWMKNLKCYGDSDTSVLTVCNALETNLSEKDSITATSEVCAILRETAKVNAEIREKEKNNEELALIGQTISSQDVAPNLDKFLEVAQKDPDKLVQYSEADMSHLMGQIQTTQKQSTAHLNRFSKEALRQKRIEKILGELRAKKGMGKYFNEDGSINSDAVIERAEEEGVDVQD